MSAESRAFRRGAPLCLFLPPFPFVNRLFYTYFSSCAADPPKTPSERMLIRHPRGMYVGSSERPLSRQPSKQDANTSITSGTRASTLYIRSDKFMIPLHLAKWRPDKRGRGGGVLGTRGHQHGKAGSLLENILSRSSVSLVPFLLAYPLELGRGGLLSFFVCSGGGGGWGRHLPMSV